ncbi:MAG TPA: hypothetical protein VLK22_01565 [Candidatus Udaeobacter sp.]|nr:hypothetical protein [Candidatus Udaeobacter sp.]
MFNEALKNAPRYLIIRYNSLSSYVWDNLFPNDYRRKVLSRIKTLNERKNEYKMMRSISDEATLLVFIFVINNFFTEGSRMAKKTIDILKEFNVSGFYLGRSFFEERNENVVLGDRLAQRLLALLDNKTRDLVLNSKYIYEILEKYKEIRG